MSDVRFQIDECAADDSPVSELSQDTILLQPCPPAVVFGSGGGGGGGGGGGDNTAAYNSGTGCGTSFTGGGQLLSPTLDVDQDEPDTSTTTTANTSTACRAFAEPSHNSTCSSSSGGQRRLVGLLAGDRHLSPASCETATSASNSASLSAARPPRKALKVEFIGMEEIEDPDKTTDRTKRAVENDLNRFHGRKGAHQSARFRQPRMSLLGKPINYRAHKRDARYRRAQAKIYNFLERPKDWRAISYHLLV